MDQEQADALRKPFDKKAVGKLPKPLQKDSPRGKCGECGGYHGLPAVHLDYVGHAATTDRLLQVDPEWTWRPMASDPTTGLPLPDGQGNLWIWLTVCGVTRPGCGDGASMKERIGDAIRNAAMRFGVALDLWSKEELEGAHGEAEKPERKAERLPAAPDDDPFYDTPAGDPLDRQVTAGQLQKIGISMSKRGLTVREDALDYVEATIGRRVASRNELTRREAAALLDALDALPTTAPEEA